MSLYRYAGADPVNFHDLNGQESIDTVLKVAADLSAGFGDQLTSGFGVADLLGLPSLTEAIRISQGTNDVVSKCSLAYAVGEYAADAWLAAATGAAAHRAGFKVWAHRYPKAGGGGVGINKNGQNLIRLDWHKFKKHGRMMNRPHIDIPGVVKHWPW